ncbi:exo-rhamnogalacturonan lyase family protein [Paenibacillus sp. YAF4_2]|uniref:exo-rhamnogalacturonan lyase family protein n=1 Tax=Paenibacillus sp. YAF4_2 TaxID=3233085 RepID=UPI003F993C60
MALNKTIQLNRLSQKVSMPVGMTWGVPWREGELRRDEALCLTRTEDGTAVPMQHWATAYWPDESVKWTAHAAAEPEGGADAYSLTKGETTSPRQQIIVTQTDETIQLDTGVMVLTLGRSGSQWLHSITRGGAEVCSGGELVGLKETSSEASGIKTTRSEPFESQVHRMAIEQEGPVRAVVKIDGRHRAAGSSREWLPFSMRLYVYAGLETIRIVHTFYYDGNPNEDFIKGIGIRFAVPMRGEHYNRHVRFAGDSGLFAESPKTLHTRRTKGKYRDLFEEQTLGRSVSFDPEEDAYFLSLLDDSATWDSFKVMQQSSEHYRIWKRTSEGCSWVKVTDGRRAGGMAYVGGSGGGLACGLRNFWQKHPSGFEVHGTAQDQASLTVWLWSPDGEAMDLRHYDTKTHVESSYEGAEELRATPYGIANTNELTLWCTEETPAPELLEQMRQETDHPSLLVCEPAYYHEAGAFGIWSLPDRSTEAKRELEERLDGIISFYQDEVEQRKWYGLWDYGDFMHSYDPVRHVWNYDLGGCAWQNTELAPNMWLWIMFLRSGREDIFRMAEAMTRHTSEVDVYHFGEYAGLGSRHNVVHWGCGCKEARIGMAGLHRYFYYLTADERIGDMMDEVRDSDYTTVNLDPMRYYFPKDEHPTHVRVGPDWAAFSSNWMTRWERYEDTAYRDKILVGINSIKGANYGLISGPTYGYDPKTGVLTPMGDDNWGRHLAICMGGPQVWFELAGMLKDPQWEEMMAELGVYYNKSQEEKDKLTHGQISTKRFEHPVLSAAIVAYGAYYKKDEETARKCWGILLGNPFANVHLQEEASIVTHVDTLREIDWMNTNEAAQWSLNTIIALELIADYLPEQQELKLQEQSK